MSDSKIAIDFSEKHKDAQFILCQKDGDKWPLAALYTTPWGSTQKEFKALCRSVQDDFEYGFSLEQEEIQSLRTALLDCVEAMKSADGELHGLVDVYARTAREFLNEPLAKYAEIINKIQGRG